jgi:hypothetical protein
VSLVAHYVPNAWTDNVTPVDKAHMDKIENGLVEAADLYYLGDWSAGTYKEGDIVVYNGVAYIAVRQTSAAPVPWPPAPSPTVYGTTLPASPVDGQEAILVDSVTNPSYQWRFRYNAGSSSGYKWELVGGAPALVPVFAAETTTSAPYVDLATPGPSFTVPRSGDYYTSFGAQGAGSLKGSVLSLSCGGNGFNWAVPDVNYGSLVSFSDAVRSINASTVVKLQYGINFGGTGTFQQRWLQVMPRRVA